MPKISKIVPTMVIKKPVKVDYNVDLPNEPSIPSCNLEDFNIIFHGERGIGKTTLGIQFPKALFLKFEPPNKSLSYYYKVPVDWNNLLSIRDTLVKDRKIIQEKFKTLIFDTGAGCYYQCLDYVLDKMGISDPQEEAGWGKGWKTVRKEFEAFFTSLRKAKYTIIVIAHSEYKEIVKADKTKYNKLSIELGKIPWRYFNSTFALTGYYNYDVMGKRRLTIQGSQDLVATNKIKGHFKWTDGSSMDHIPMGDSEEQAYKNFIAAFNNRFIKPQSQSQFQKKEG